MIDCFGSQFARFDERTEALGNVIYLDPALVRFNCAANRLEDRCPASLEKEINKIGGDANSIWESTESWSVPEGTLKTLIEIAASGLAIASESAACVLDFEFALGDGWLPYSVDAQRVDGINEKIMEFGIAGIDSPQIREGTIGSDARFFGAASLPLSDRFPVDRNLMLGT